MTKQELITEISIKTDSTKKDAAKYLDATIEAISDALTNGEKISLIGFGTFEVVDRAARTGRNPKSGETIEIPATKVPKFKAGAALKNAVKNA